MNSSGDEESLDPWGDEAGWEETSADEDGEITSNKIKQLSMYGAQHVIILIDTNKSMFHPCIRLHSSQQEGDSDGGESGHIISPNMDIDDDTLLVTPFDAALIAAERLLHHKVRTVVTTKTNKRDGVGVILYGSHMKTERNNSSEERGHDRIININEADDEEDDEEDIESPHANSSVRVLIDLTPPGVEQIKTIRSCLLPEHYKNKIGKNTSTYSPIEIGGITEKIRERDLQKELFGFSVDAVVKTELQDEQEINGVNDHNEMNLEEEEVEYSPLRPALHEANREFLNAKCVKNVSKYGQQSDSTTIWIFTNQSNPVPINANPTEIDQLKTVAKDVLDNGSFINAWPLPNKDGLKFDFNIFYHDIVTEYNDGDGVISPTQECKGETYLDLDNLLEGIVRQWKQIKKTQSIPLLLPDWNIRHRRSQQEAMIGESSIAEDDPSYPGIMLDLYQVIKIKRKPTHVTINSMTNKRTNRITQIYARETGALIPKELMKERIRYYTEFGGDPVQISKEEIADIKKHSNSNPENASLILLGFKPLPTAIEPITQIPMVDKSIFAYPNDDTIKGSRTAFATLHASMVRKSVMGVGELLLRVTATSRLVAIVPQEEKTENFEQITAPGFLLIPLAFEDDVRTLPSGNCYETDQGMVNAAMDLIKNQNIESGIEIGQSFENPFLKTFWNYIESCALDTPLDEDSEDDTMMNEEDILASAGRSINEFKSLLPNDDMKLRKPRKRKAAGTS